MEKLIGGFLLLCGLLSGIKTQYIYGAVPPASDLRQHQVGSIYGIPPHQIGRSQRSLYSHGWSPVGVGPITKDDIITLLEAWKEMEKPISSEPESEPESESEPEPEPSLDAKPPPPAAPITVSLPAFVPIQLSAMYTAPVPLATPTTAPAPEPEPEHPAEPEQEPEPIQQNHPWLQFWSPPALGRKKQIPYVMRSVPKIKSLEKPSTSRSHHSDYNSRVYSVLPTQFMGYPKGQLSLASQLKKNIH